MKLNPNVIAIATVLSVVSAAVYLIKQFGGKIAEKGQEAVDSVSSAIAAPIVNAIQRNTAEVSGNMVMPSGLVVPLQYLANPTAQRTFDNATNTILFFHSGSRYRVTPEFNSNGDRIVKAA